MAFFGQSDVQTPQPTHCVASMTALPSRTLIAGQPMPMHALQRCTFRIDRKRRLMLHGLEQRARAAADHNARTFRLQRLVDRRARRLEVVRVDDAHVRNADGAAQRLEVDRARRVALDRVAGRRVLLVAGHAGNRVVEDDHRGIRAVVGDVDQARDARVDERRIADHGDRLLFRLGAARLVVAVERRNRSAHADADVHRAERGRGAERVAADVAADIDALALERVEKPPVRAAAAHDGRAHRDVLFERDAFAARNAELLGDQLLRKLAAARENILADDRHADFFAVRFDDVVQLLDDVDRLEPRGKAADLSTGSGLTTPSFR